jgi:hypothetical protein
MEYPSVIGREEETAQKGQWNTIHRTLTFCTWAGDTFELLCIENLRKVWRVRLLDRTTEASMPICAHAKNGMTS